jgi:hypothetical protein
MFICLQVASLLGNETLAESAIAYYSQGLRRPGQLGCILSHLTTIRGAYLAGDEMALLLEDDVAPYFMPYWTISLQGLVDLASMADTPWETIQLHSHWDRGDPLWNLTANANYLIGGHLLETRFRHSAAAYIISRRGMSKIMDMFFSNHTSQGVLRLARREPDNPDWDGGPDSDGYLPTAITSNLVAVPNPFMTHDVSSHFGASRGWEPGKVFGEFHMRMWRLHVENLQRRHHPELFEGF